MVTPSSLLISGPQQWTLPGAPPRFATPRNPARYTEGDQVRVIANSLSTPLIPWQSYVADVAGEREPGGAYDYEVIYVSTTRQSGKTVLLRSVGTQRAVSGRDCFYTAQTGKAARARWLDLVQILQLHPTYRKQIKVSLRGGEEHVSFPGGARFQCFAPTPDSLHSYTIPTVMVDEAFKQTANSGELLMGAIGPTQFTIIDKQIWIVSTAGTAESEWFHDGLDEALAGKARVAVFDWGARDDQNPYDLDDIAAFHPGVGFELNGKILTAQDVLNERSKNTDAEYERAYANRRTATGENLIPLVVAQALRLDGNPETLDLSEAVLTYDVAHDRQSATIMATWTESTGRPCSMILKAQPGASWLVDELDDLITNSRPRAFGAVDSGPVTATTKRLQLKGHEPEILNGPEFVAACSDILSAIDDQSFDWYVTTDDAAELMEESITGLVTRRVTDGVAFSREHSAGDSSPAIAMTAGLALLDRHRSTGRPEFHFRKKTA